MERYSGWLLLIIWFITGALSLAIAGSFIFIFVNIITQTVSWWIPVVATFGFLFTEMIALVTMVWLSDKY